MNEEKMALFNVRFLLDMKDISKHYIDETAKKLQVENEIAEYFKEKIYNIDDSGLIKTGCTGPFLIKRKEENKNE